MVQKTHPDIKYLYRLAQIAGHNIRNSFYSHYEVGWKPDGSPVTEIDKENNRFVIESLHKDFPHVKVLGEEGSRDITDAEYTVSFDPLDGTAGWICGMGIATFCIALLNKGVPTIGIVYDPFVDETYSAVKGERAYRNFTHPLRVSEHKTLLRLNAGIFWWKDAPYNLPHIVEAFSRAGGSWMQPPSLAYCGVRVASGKLGAIISPVQFGWETAALQIIVEEAGGMVTDIYGNQMKYGPNGEISGHIISNGHVHEQLVALVASCQT